MLKVYWGRWSIIYAKGEKKYHVAESDHCIDAEVGRMVLFRDMEYLLLNG